MVVVFIVVVVLVVGGDNVYDSEYGDDNDGYGSDRGDGRNCGSCGGYGENGGGSVGVDFGDRF